MRHREREDNDRRAHGAGVHHHPGPARQAKRHEHRKNDREQGEHGPEHGAHGDADHRNNFFAGGKPVATEITERDREIIRTLKPELCRLGLMFVGIDV
ncbi:MAG: hypothetical protein QGF53_14450, partial [Alphaproteobacteria bacterium]|nr:hypothetical protein [Alphaproteobacteria bacterium]